MCNIQKGWQYRCLSGLKVGPRPMRIAHLFHHAKFKNVSVSSSRRETNSNILFTLSSAKR